MLKPILMLETRSKALPFSALIKKAVKAAEPFLEKHPGGEFSVLVTGDKKIRALNHDYRGKNKETNVLSFPQYAPRELKKIKPEEHVYLGDIALSLPYCVAEAKRLKKPLKHHFTHLVVHGLLHLLGYDHGSDKQAHAMETLEKEILATLNIPDPYKMLAASRHEHRHD